MPRLKKPCVGCGKQVTPNYADTVPRCRKCYDESVQQAPTTKREEAAFEEQDELIAAHSKRTLAPARGGIKIMMIPDLQIGPGTPTEHLDWIAKYAVEKRPDVIVQIGDWADMPSLSSYDRGKKAFEGRRIQRDLDAAEASIERFTRPISRTKGYKPRMLVTLGNHEDRITRAVNEDARLEGLVSTESLPFRGYGWEVFPFLVPVTIAGVQFAHYFTSGVRGKAVSSAKALLAKTHTSAVMGHSQVFDVAVHPETDHIGIISGACYIHDEDYLGPQQNSQKRQIVMLHEVKDGKFDPMFVSLSYLEKRMKG